jgi:uncharacterized membrane protein (UPF0182 family)
VRAPSLYTVSEGEEIVVEGERVRLVRVRRVDLGAVLRLSLVLYVCLFAFALVVALGLWALGRSTGVVDNIEHFVADLGFRDFHLLDAEILRTTLLAGPILVVLAALATVAVGAIFNLVSRLTGGVEVTVSEAETP